MSGERRQFRALMRLFAYRFFDTDIVSVRGDLSSLLAQFAALLAALSFVLLLAVTPKYAGLYQHLTAAQLGVAAWGDQEFLISTTMAIVGVFTLLLWDALFPDRRDCLILGVMPVHARTIFRAKLAALGSALGLAIVAANCFTGVVCPFLIVRGPAGVAGILRGFAAYWLVILLASLFVFLVLIGLQGAALHLLPHGRFLRWSSFLQMGAFFAILALYFLTPPLAGRQEPVSPGNRIWYELVPSYWFLGLFQSMTGAAETAQVLLAKRAIAGTIAAGLTATIFYELAYRRQMRRTAEQAGIVPSGRPLALVRAAGRIVSRQASERAILDFIRRTLARSRQHRLLLAIYTGMGLAYVFSQVAYVLYHFRADGFGAVEGREQTMLGIPLILLFFLVIGLRVSFSIPMELPANWLFRLAGPFGGRAYLAASRKTLLWFALAPVAVLSAAIYPLVWPWPKAAGHVAFLTVFGLLIIELALTGFDKIPFTCSYLPGKANLKIMFGVYWGLLIIVSEVVTAIEIDALRHGFGRLMAVTLAAWLAAAGRARRVRSRVSSLRFEEQPEPAVAGLGLAGPL